MANMTLQQVYGPWRELGRAWTEEEHEWAQMTVSWDDQAITWAEALQPWAASISHPPVRILPVPAEFRVRPIHSEQRVVAVAPQS